MPFGAMAESRLKDMDRQRALARVLGRIRMWIRGRMGGSYLVHVSLIRHQCKECMIPTKQSLLLQNDKDVQHLLSRLDAYLKQFANDS